MGARLSKYMLYDLVRATPELSSVKIPEHLIYAESYIRQANTILVDCYDPNLPYYADGRHVRAKYRLVGDKWVYISKESLPGYVHPSLR